MKTKLYTDPDGSIAAKLFAMLLGGLLSSVCWFLLRTPNGSIIMVFGAGFMVMAAAGEFGWGDKFRLILAMAVFSGILQFGDAMLDQQQVLLLLWWFGFCFFIFWRWRKRMASTAVVALGCFGIVQTAGYQPGVDRFIAQLVACGCALIAMVFVEFSTVPLRVKNALESYRRELAGQLENILHCASPERREHVKMEVLRCARIANNLIAAQRFLFPHHRAAAARAIVPLGHLHVMSRAVILMENISDEELVVHRDYLSRLVTAMADPSVAVDLTVPVDATPALAVAGRIIASELTALRDSRRG